MIATPCVPRAHLVALLNIRAPCRWVGTKQVIRDGDGAPGPTGFSALVVSQGLGATGKKFFSDYTWEAPGVIRVRSRPDKETSPRFGASLHCIPLGKGRSRLLFKVSVRVSVQ